ncbi:MAG TPA: T9SS type A sorting domain-containing protein [Edaphocola sp.]|nr:T9SS type A sorting domain-containing protein [Edaphocola sp.]
MKKILNFFLIIWLLPISNFAQGFDTTFAFGTTNNSNKYSNIINVLADNDKIIFTGTSNKDSIVSGFINVMPFIGATDYQGNLLWIKGIKADSNDYVSGVVYFRNSLSKISPNKYVMPIQGYDGLNPYHRLVFFNNQGDTLKTISFQGYNQAGINFFEAIMSLCVDDDKNIVITGSSNTFTPNPTADTFGLYIAKFDSNGVFQWKKHYYSMFNGQNNIGFRGVKILPANEGNGYIISSLRGSNDSIGNSVFHFVRIDSMGNKLWEKGLPKVNTLFGGDDDLSYTDFIKANDGSGYYFNTKEYILVYENNNNTFMSYIGKVDNQANVLWAKTINFNYRDVKPYDMAQMDNGDLVFNIQIWDQYTPTPKNISNGSTLLCTDSLGNIKWHKAYYRYPCEGSGRRLDEPFTVISKSPYNSIAMGGEEGLAFNNPLANCYTSLNHISKLALVDSLGRRHIDDTTTINLYPIVTQVDFSTGIKTAVNHLKELIDIFPNPAGQDLFISIKEKGNYKIEIQDINGRSRMNKNLGADITQIDIANWQAGIYFIKVFENNTYLGAFKFVKR